MSLHEEGMMVDGDEDEFLYYSWLWSLEFNWSLRH